MVSYLHSMWTSLTIRVRNSLRMFISIELQQKPHSQCDAWWPFSSTFDNGLNSGSDWAPEVDVQFRIRGSKVNAMQTQLYAHNTFARMSVCVRACMSGCAHDHIAVSLRTVRQFGHRNTVKVHAYSIFPWHFDDAHAHILHRGELELKCRLCSTPAEGCERTSNQCNSLVLYSIWNHQIGAAGEEGLCTSLLLSVRMQHRCRSTALYWLICTPAACVLCAKQWRTYTHLHIYLMDDNWIDICTSVHNTNDCMINLLVFIGFGMSLWERMGGWYSYIMLGNAYVMYQIDWAFFIVVDVADSLVVIICAYIVDASIRFELSNRDWFSMVRWVWLNTADFPIELISL